MAWVWTTVGVVGGVFGLLCLAAAIPVYRSGPRRLQNRLLALVLWCLGLAWLGGAGLMYSTDDPRSTYAWQVAAFGALAPVPWLYVAFLSTLPTPLARPLARLRPFLYAAAVATAAAVVARPEAFVARVVPGTFAPWDVAGGPAFQVLFLGLAATGVLGLGVAVAAVRRTARGSAARAQAAAYLAAFAAYDASNLALLVPGLTGIFHVGIMLLQVALLTAFVGLLAYGAVKTQLFDVDLRIKVGLRRGTVATVFVGAFVVATAVAEQYLERYGALVGGVAVGFLFLALRPIERAADRLADRALPRVQDTPEYRLVKKREVYRAAVEGALDDGAVSDKERAILARLAEQLGLGPVEMHEVEREAKAARGAVAGVA